MEYIKVKDTVAELKNFFNEKGHGGLGYAQIDDKMCSYDPKAPYAIKFTADDAQTITFKILSEFEGVQFQYSFDGVEFEDWNYHVDTGQGEAIFDVISFGGDTPIYVRGTNANGTYPGYFRFGDNSVLVDVEGNIMSLIDYETETIILPDEAFYGLFRYSCLRNANKLILPATALTLNCYCNLFEGCANLVSVPELPAMTLADGCYSVMFGGCSSLVTAPVLPATTLAEQCYLGMFTDCTSLVNAPALPARTMVESCYNMMFSGCTSLVTAPELPAGTLTGNCYMMMFEGCSNLNYVKCLAQSSYLYEHTTNWLYGVASTGTFVKHRNADNWPTGESGIPDGWTVVDYAE